MLLWPKFIVAAAVVVFSGYKICIYANRLAQSLKLSRGFIGFMLLAVVTSLPELVVTISATKFGALNLALADLFGSNLFNLTIVGVILLVFTKRPKLLTFESAHFISSAFSVLLIAVAMLGIVFYSFINPQLSYSKFFLDVESALILVIYIFGTYLVFRSEKGRIEGVAESDSLKKNALGIWLRFLFYGAILVGFAIFLSQLGDRIAHIPVKGVALGGTFVGGLFIALTTSLPEMAVAISAVRLGFLDMALGDIFGSNMFNIFIIPIMDLTLGRKIVLSSVGAIHLFTAIFVIISTALVLAGLTFRSRRKVPALAWDSAAILFVYFVANLVNFYLR